MLATSYDFVCSRHVLTRVSRVRKELPGGAARLRQLARRRCATACRPRHPPTLAHAHSTASIASPHRPTHGVTTPDCAGAGRLLLLRRPRAGPPRRAARAPAGGGGRALRPARLLPSVPGALPEPRRQAVPAGEWCRRWGQAAGAGRARSGATCRQRVCNAPCMLEAAAAARMPRVTRVHLPWAHHHRRLRRPAGCPHHRSVTTRPAAPRAPAAPTATSAG